MAARNKRLADNSDRQNTYNRSPQIIQPNFNNVKYHRLRQGSDMQCNTTKSKPPHRQYNGAQRVSAHAHGRQLQYNQSQYAVNAPIQSKEKPYLFPPYVNKGDESLQLRLLNVIEDDEEDQEEEEEEETDLSCRSVDKQTSIVNSNII